MSYPKQVPILTNKDLLCHGSFNCKAKKHCLMEWANIVFGAKEVAKKQWYYLDDEIPGVPRRAYKAILEACVEVSKVTRLKIFKPSNSVRCSIVNFNDSGKPSELAKVWNLAMKNLGYKWSQ